DRAQLNSVIMNLGSNAADAMQGGPGRMLASLTRVSADGGLAARFPTIADGAAYARIRIQDTGSGMNEATLQKIFDPFFTTKPVGEGTGLGLAMVHGIIEGLRGAVDVTSEVGVGTTFDL